MIIKFPTESDIPKLKEIWKEAFGDTDDFIDLFFSMAFSKSSSLCVYDNDFLAASLYWFDGYVGNEKAAYIYGVATKKAHRGRGFSSALIKRTHELLAKKGYQVSVLVPADAGLFNFYRRLGYTECCFIELEKQFFSEKRTTLTKISAEEYLNLRNDYLPPNTFIFDNKRLRFLASITDFYKGKDFILAKNKVEDPPSIIEFFGNESLIPDVIGTLGYTEATIRSYGNSKPFAMYYPLTKNLRSIPEYLGFAFD